MKYEQTLNQYIELCNQGKNRKEITEILHVSLRSVTNYQKATGVFPASNKRKARLDEEFFSTIDSEEKAYILGFLFADGYLESNERVVTLNVSKKDIDVIYKIKDSMHCENEIRQSSTKNCVRLYMASIKLVSDLKKLGFDRNKSLTISFPDISDGLIRHFIRGFFDGDGHVGKRQCVLVIGSEKFFNDFNHIIEKEFGKKLYHNNMGNYYRVQFNRCDHEIIKWLYDNCSIYLDRKYKAYKQYWESYSA